MFVGCRRRACCQGYCAVVGQTERQALTGRGLEVVGPWGAGGLQVKRLMREKQGVIYRVRGSYAKLKCRRYYYSRWSHVHPDTIGVGGEPYRQDLEGLQGSGVQSDGFTVAGGR